MLTNEFCPILSHDKGELIFAVDDHLVSFDNNQLKQIKSVVYVDVCILLPMSFLDLLYFSNIVKDKLQWLRDCSVI